MRLNELSETIPVRAHTAASGSGRGIGSGPRQDCQDAGNKGQKSRSAVSPFWGFEGGQMPLYRQPAQARVRQRIPRARSTASRSIFGRIQHGDRRGPARRQAQRSTPQALRAAGLVKKPRDGIRSACKGRAEGQSDDKRRGASKAAVAAVEKAGGRSSYWGSAEGVAAGDSEKSGKQGQGGEKANRDHDRLRGRSGEGLRRGLGPPYDRNIPYGLRRRTTRRQHQLRRPVQGDGAEEAHLVHARARW